MTDKTFLDSARTLVGAVEAVIDKYAAFAEACGSEGSVLDGSSWYTFETEESSTVSCSARSTKAHYAVELGANATQKPVPKEENEAAASPTLPNLRDVPPCFLGLWRKKAPQIRPHDELRQALGEEQYDSLFSGN
ncbi:hypothetical protein MTO96_003457 [Rhipicephalus appendiculatus]